MASPFLRRVQERTGIKATTPENTLIEPAQAMLHASSLTHEQLAPLRPLLEARETWKASRQPNDKLHIQSWAMPLLKLRYPPEKAFSATALEKYAGCPFQHFAVKTLGLEEFERDDAAMRNGLFIHGVLEEFFNESKSRGSAGWDPAAGGKLLREVFEQRWQREGHDLEPSLKHDFSRALMEAFVNVISHYSEKGFEQFAAEWEFKDVLIESDGKSILLYGKIDRIDRHKDGTIEIISDFKTGTVYDGKKLAQRLESGRLLQLPLYGLARQLSEKVPVKHGVYVRLSRKVHKDATPARIERFLEHVGEELESNRNSVPPFDPEQTGKKAVALATAMRAGRIELTKFDVDHADPVCVAYCPARHACRQPKGY